MMEDGLHRSNVGSTLNECVLKEELIWEIQK